MVQITRFAKDKIDIFRYSDDYLETKIYTQILADVQLRAYNIKDFMQESIEVENTEKYYIMTNKRNKNIRPGDIIVWNDELWQTKRLLVTSLSMERFLSRGNLIEIRAKDYAINE